MHQYKPTQIDKSRSVLVALKWVEHAIWFIYEAVCNNVFAEENCFFYETENDLLGRGRLLYSLATDHCASLNHATVSFIYSICPLHDDQSSLFKKQWTLRSPKK